jgi:hypothetical protein
MARSDDAPLSKNAFEQLADFRYQMRRFERFSERAARSHGVTPLQYLLLLHIKGFSDPHSPMSANLLNACRRNLMAWSRSRRAARRADSFNGLPVSGTAEKSKSLDQRR